jgi:Ca2+-binding RTX toxin-like protein
LVSITYSTQLGAGIPTFMTGITDLEVVWINGLPKLYSAARPGMGAGYTVHDISNASGPATLQALQGYSAPIDHGTTPGLAVINSGGANFLIAAGLTPSGWASYGLTSTGGFGGTLNTPLAFDPTSVVGYTSGGATYVYLTPDGSGQPLVYQLFGNGSLVPVANGSAFAGLAENVDDTAVAATAEGTFLLAASAQGNAIYSYAIGANGSLGLAGQLTMASGVGMSKPTAIDAVTLNGTTYAIVAASESSSVSVFRVLPGGGFYAVDHVVDNLTNRFAGATALSTLQIGQRAYVLVGGSDDGVEVMTLLPDGRLIHLLTIADTANLTLADVTAIATAQVGSRTEVFVASASEPGITQLDLNLGLQGVSIYGAAGVQTGTSNNDVLIAGASTTAIYGGNGDDILATGGPAGSAVLHGGAGSDIFVLAASDTVLQIADYQPGIDKLDLTSFALLRNLGQLTITSTASGADITYLTTTIHIESATGNPLASTAFAQSQLMPLTRFSPYQTTDLMVGTLGADLLSATANDTSLLGLDGNDTLWGGSGDDYIDGGAGNDSIRGGGGNDLISGISGADLLWGEGGSDTLIGDLGNDLAYGGDGNDVLSGDAGFDTLYGDLGDDLVDGGDDADWLYGGDGNDVLGGGSGDDTLYGDAGDDVGNGGTGNDLIYGGDGNDSLYGGAGADSLFGGNGRNYLDGGDGNDMLWGGVGNDSLVGGAGNDTLQSDMGDDIVWGQSGNDIINGYIGNDTLCGDEGDDILYGSFGNDRLFGGDGSDTSFGEDGDDALFGENGNDYQYGGNGSDTLYGGAGHDSLLGGSGADLIDGGTDSDTIFGGSENDTLLGGDGNDFLFGDAGNNLIYGGNGDDFMRGDSGQDTIYGDAGNDRVFAFDGNDSIYGGFGNDCLFGGGGDDRILGGYDNDTLYGGDGNDILFGEIGNDLVVGDSGDDVLLGVQGEDTLIGGTGNDSIYGGTGNDILIGQQGNDILLGGDGNDAFRGGEGADILYGGAGSDFFVYGSAAEIGIWGATDIIRDFQPGIDKLNFRGMGLHFSGNGGLSRSPGELKYFVQGSGIFMMGDLNGDAVADFALRLENIYSIAASDLYL